MELHFFFLWEEANLLKRESWWNETDKADWQGMIDDKDGINLVLCQTMLQFLPSENLFQVISGGI